MGSINLLEARRNILMSQPHLTTESANPMTFKTDISANLKDCKIYFKPVQEGSGDPSPDNVRPISGWDGVTVARNWFSEIDNYETSHDGITFTRNPNDGIVTIKGTATARVQRAFSGRFMANGDNYIFQNFPVLSGSFYWYVYDMTSSTMVTNGGNILNLNGRKLKPTSGHEFVVAINIPKNATVDLTFKPVIYDETETITIPFPKTLYGGYVDLVRGEVVEEWYSLTITEVGSPYRQVSVLSSGNTKVSWFLDNRFNAPRAVPYVAYDTNGYCSHLKFYNNNYNNNPRVGVNNAVIEMILPGELTKEDIDAWFIDNPVTVCYRRATPITHQLADGLNHITLGQNISPMLNGRSSTGGYANSTATGIDGCKFVYFELGWPTEAFLQYSADISRRPEFVSDSSVLINGTTTDAKLGEMIVSTGSATDYDGDALVYLYVSVPSDCTDLASKRAYLAEHPIKITYPKKSPVPYTIDMSNLKPVKGTNNIWSDANGNIEIKFWKH